MRIGKYLSHYGICSRREGEGYIRQGRVQVNGETIQDLGRQIAPEDQVIVDGVLVGEKPTPKIWILHKPIETITSRQDPEGRRTIFDLLPENFPRVVSVGRLDYLSEGLLLLTNSPDIAHALERPSTRIPRIYEVTVCDLPFQKWGLAEKGMTVDGMRYAPLKVEILDDTPTYHVHLTLFEGKNREIRNIVKALGGKIKKLKRIQYGKFSLENLGKEQVQEVPEKAVQALMTELNLKKGLD